MRSIFGRTLQEQRRALIGWMIGVGVLAIWLVAAFPSISANTEMSKLLESYPESMRTMFQIDDFTSGIGYLRAEVFSFTLPLLLTIAAVLWGSDSIAGEEDRGTLDLLLAQPVTRRRVAFAKWAAMLVSLSVVAFTLGLFLVVGGMLVDLEVPIVQLVAAILSSMLLAVTFASVAQAIGAATGRRGLARGVTLALAVSAYLVSSLSALMNWLEPARPFSPWYHALGVDPLARGFLVGHLAALVVGCVVVTVLGVVGFERRDLDG